MHSLFKVVLPTALLFAAFTVSAANVEDIQSPAAAGSLAPSIATLADGRLVLTWLEPLDEGHALKFSVLDEGGFGPAMTIARGEDWFANWADTPGLFVLPDGAWLAHWLRKSGPSTYAYDVVMAGSQDAGRTWSEPFSPHDDGTQTEHGFVSYFSESPSVAGVVWLDGRRTEEAGSGGHEGHAGAMTLRAARVDARGRVAAGALLDERVCDCCQTASVMTARGPVVVYRDRSADEIRDHYVVRRLDGRWTEPERLYEDGWRIGGCPVNGPALLGRGERVVAAWFTMPEGRPMVRVAASNDAGAEFDLLDTLGAGSALGRVDLAWLGTGFAVSWVDEVDGQGVLRLTGYGADGQLAWQKHVDGVDAGRASGFPRLARLGDCGLIVAWTGKDADGGQRVQVETLVAENACTGGSGS